MTKFEDLLESNFLEIKNAKINFTFAPTPCELDKKISDLIKLFIQSTPSERLLFHEKAKPISGYLNTFAIRSATLAVREQSRQRVLEGLVALVVEDCRTGDYRDTLTALAPLYHSAGKIGLDADTLLKDAASYMNNESSKHIRRFADRPAYSKKLRDFGFQEVDDTNGFRYEMVF